MCTAGFGKQLDLDLGPWATKHTHTEKSLKHRCEIIQCTVFVRDESALVPRRDACCRQPVNKQPAAKTITNVSDLLSGEKAHRCHRFIAPGMRRSYTWQPLNACAKRRGEYFFHWMTAPLMTLALAILQELASPPFPLSLACCYEYGQPYRCKLLTGYQH